MQITTGQKVFSMLASVLLSLNIPGRSSVEKISASRAGLAGARTSCIRPQPCPALTGIPKTLMLASWYGKKFQGRKTASGEQFDLKKLTAASRTLPFGSLVRLTAPTTGRSVVVRINDRGPWLKDRDFDLSEAAAMQLGIERQGIAAVEVTQFR